MANNKIQMVRAASCSKTLQITANESKLNENNMVESSSNKKVSQFSKAKRAAMFGNLLYLN